MALIVSPPQTKEDFQAQTKALLQVSINRLFAQMKTTYLQGKRLVENNPRLTKQDVLDGLGADATELVRLASLLKDCLNLAVPGTIPEDGEYGA
jgi:hypothetical protein